MKNTGMVECLLKVSVYKFSETYEEFNHYPKHQTPLTLAVELSNCKTLEVLLSYDVKKEFPEGFDERRSLFILARMLQKTDMMEVLLEAGVNLEIKDENDRTAVAIASREGYMEGVKLLVEAGADKDTIDKENKTPGQLTREAGREDVVKDRVEARSLKRQFLESNSNNHDIARQIN